MHIRAKNFKRVPNGYYELAMFPKKVKIYRPITAVLKRTVHWRFANRRHLKDQLLTSSPLVKRKKKDISNRY
jgi:hypothetical protein